MTPRGDYCSTTFLFFTFEYVAKVVPIPPGVRDDFLGGDDLAALLEMSR